MVAVERGFTLIEAMIVVTLIGMLAVVGVPYTASWFHEADVQKTANVLQSAYGRAKSVALRNPHSVTGDTPAAGLASAGNSVLVCSGDPSAAACAVGGANLVWQSELPAGITLTINSVAMSSHRFNNTGQSIDGAGTITALTYAISKGSRSYDGELR